MTFNNAAWAIDGPLTTSSLARIQAYSATNGSEGIVQKGDLKVSALDVPGQGIQIGSGSALLLNRYMTNPDQTYTVSNPDVHTVEAVDMPPSHSSPKSYIVAVTIGDPEFSQSGHPWMTGDDPAAGTEDDFIYVRPFLIPCSAGATSLGDIGYPAIALARVDIPADTTTIIGSYIHDLRELANPRTRLYQGFAEAPDADVSVTAVNPGRQRFPNFGILTVKVPEWAVKAKIMGYVEGLRLIDGGVGSLQPYIETTSLAGETTNIKEEDPSISGDRRSYNLGGEIDVRSIAGDQATFSVRAWVADIGTDVLTPSVSFLHSDKRTSVMLSVYFEEQPT